MNRITSTEIDLNELTDELPELMEMIVTIYSGNNTDKITTFIGNHPTLMKFQKVIVKYFVKDSNRIGKSIFNQKDAFLFESKNEL